MSPDTITIVVAIIGTGVAFGLLIVPSLREFRREPAAPRTNAISTRVPRDARTESRLWSPSSASPVHGEGRR